MSQIHSKIVKVAIRMAAKHHRRLAERAQNVGNYTLAEYHENRAEELDLEMELCSSLDTISPQELLEAAT
jgi:hypothetical protein